MQCADKDSIIEKRTRRISEEKKIFYKKSGCAEKGKQQVIFEIKMAAAEKYGLQYVQDKENQYGQERKQQENIENEPWLFALFRGLIVWYEGVDNAGYPEEAE